MLRTLLVTISLAAPLSHAHADLAPLPAQPPDVPWPTTEWPVGSLPLEMDSAAFSAVIADAFDKRAAGLGETRELVIIRGGRLIYERAAQGYNTNTRLVSWSMAKSITQALVGIAVAQGKINIDQPMGSPHWSPDDRRAQIPWRQWLQMTDGQRYLEIEAETIAESDASRKLFGPGRLDVASYCAGLPLIHEPGTHWNYNSCGIVLTADALTRTIVPNPASPEQRRGAMLRWMNVSLFDVIGMKPQPEFDAAGLMYGSALIYASARDFARFGLLYLRDGMWDGRRVLPEGWVDFARTHGTGTNADIYGAGWWLAPKHGSGRPYPIYVDTGPERDGFSAQGFEGQYTLVVPSKDLIVVRLGMTPEKDLRTGALKDWMGRVARTFPSTAATPSAATE
ncbi:serine hydrolase domain-containing protein [Peristeroidobacter agariperforans]|uniref:serine hydrolase domain-containing protein n=1 Tax=Peristeroidobacter agariperforans TaxID=268404 RepID=UPI00101DB748|nr:serine hydrolase [Peristeroidobacter agariperforans]